MIFEKDGVSFKLLEVLELRQKDVNLFNRGRNFDAISFRYEAETSLITKNERVRLKSGSLCYVPAGVDYTRVSENDNLIVVHFNSFNYSSKNIQYFYPENHDGMLKLFEKLLACWNEKSAGYRYTCTALLYEIFALSYTQTCRGKRYDSKILEGVNFINDNFSAPDISVKAAAEKSNMSEVYFRRLFKQSFGVSPKKHIISLRIKRAVTLIESGYYSLSEVAEMCGFTDYKYFSCEFKSQTGVSPSKFSYIFDRENLKKTKGEI